MFLGGFVPKMDNEFYERADAHIELANDHINEEVSRGKASSSLLYSASRFNAWISACGWNNSEEMAGSKEETIEYFVTEYRKMLEENLDDYIENFNQYMQVEESET